MSKCFTEPHSTKAIEDSVGWGLETDAETLIALSCAPRLSEEQVQEMCPRIQCPVLVMQGDADQVSPHGRGVALAEATGGTLVTMVGSGHLPLARDPVRVNLLLRQFISPPRPVSSWTRGRSRRKRAVHLLADRARPRAARRGDRRRVAQAAPGPGDRLARAASRDAGAQGSGRADPSGQPPSGLGVRPHRERVRGARPARLPGHPPHGRGPAEQLHGVPRRRQRGRLRPLDRR